MPPHATVEAAKQTAPFFLGGLWIGLQSAAQSVFSKKGRRSALPGHDRGAPSPDPVGYQGPAAAPVARHDTPDFVNQYRRVWETAWDAHDWSDVAFLVDTLRRCWRENRQVFLCGNGGSAANAIHLANDLIYGVAKDTGKGLRVTALPSNPSVMTCLANDIGYEDVFAQQLTVLAQPGDVLIAFSGSGNSPNIVKALVRARELGVTTFAVLGFSGGEALRLTDHPIHFAVDDMQVSEDLQMMIGHMAMQSLATSGRLAVAES